MSVKFLFIDKLISFCRQRFQLLSVKDADTKDMKIPSLQIKYLQHELPDEDLTQGRGIVEKEAVYKTVSQLF